MESRQLVDDQAILVYQGADTISPAQMILIFVGISCVISSICVLIGCMLATGSENLGELIGPDEE